MHVSYVRTYVGILGSSYRLDLFMYIYHIFLVVVQVKIDRLIYNTMYMY